MRRLAPIAAAILARRRAACRMPRPCAGRARATTSPPTRTAQNELLTNSINGHVYESLVMRGKKLEILPALAASWKQTSPTVWVFNLRKGVKWHDGSDFTADDVVFSIKRLQGETSNFRVYGNAVGEPRKIDSHTVELTTPVPNPVMLEMLANSLFMMSKAWCEKNKAEKSQDFTGAGGDVHGAERDGHRAVHARLARARREERLQEEPQLVGAQGEGLLRRQRRRHRLHAGEDREHAHGGAARGQPRLRPRPAGAGHREAEAGQEHQGLRGPREPRHLPRHRPEPRRAAVLEREGQEPVQGQARAPGLLPGDRRERDQQGGDARALGAHRDQPAEPGARRASRRRWTSAIRTTWPRRRSCSPRRAIRTASSCRSTAPTTATSTTRRSAWRWRACSRRSASP